MNPGARIRPQVLTTDQACRLFEPEGTLVELTVNPALKSRGPRDPDYGNPVSDDPLDGLPTIPENRARVGALSRAKRWQQAYRRPKGSRDPLAGT